MSVIFIRTFVKIQHKRYLLQLEMYDEIFHFVIFKNFMKILKYFKTLFLKYFMKLLTAVSNSTIKQQIEVLVRLMSVVNLSII